MSNLFVKHCFELCIYKLHGKIACGDFNFCDCFAILFSMLCLIYVSNRKLLFSIFVEIFAIFIMVKTATIAMMQDPPAAHNQPTTLHVAFMYTKNALF